MDSQSLYQILELPDFSDSLSVKKAFRQLALKYHPDRNPNPEVAEKFKTIVSAYEILNNPELKQTYDQRLKHGFHYEYIKPSESDFEIKRRKYAEQRMKQSAMEEIENITAYEKSLTTFPLVYRIVISGLLFFTGIISFVSDWYIRGSKMALGLFLLVGSCLFIWNELYKYFWYKSLTKEEESYSKRAYTLFITIFLSGCLLCFGLIKLKKVWQLEHFGKVIYAEHDIGSGYVIFTYEQQYYKFETYNVPENVLYKNPVLIRISTKEPEIWEYAEE